MTERQQKFLHKAVTNRQGKWLSIALQNLGDEMSDREIEELIPLVRQAQVEKYQARIIKYVELDAPEVIMKNVQELFKKAVEGRDPCEQILQRQLRKRQVITK